MNRLQEFYKNTVIPALKEELGYKNINEVPKIEKIVVNTCLGDVKDNSKSFNMAVDEIQAITGQKPVIVNAKKSIANFKLREGMKLGAKVTLRGKTMYEFLDRFLSIALPRVRDFRGIDTTCFDGRGNFAYGVKEQLIFPEIVYDKIEKIRGFDVAIVTTAKTDDEARKLLALMGMPFKK